MRRSPIAVTALAALLAACGASEAAGPDTDDAAADVTDVADVPSTISGVGELPSTTEAAAREAAEEEEEEEVEQSTTTDAEPIEPEIEITRPLDEDTGEEVATIGEQAEGNRLIMLGDSILAATSSRYGRDMCDALVPLGWQVEVDAEPGRFIDFGNRVLRQRFDPDNGLDWDAAVVFLGSNYRGDQIAYETELEEILDTLEPRPTLLYTVTEYRPNWAQVNEVVRRQAEERDNVTLVDWEEVARTPGVLSSDRLHPGATGEQVLVELTAEAIGAAPEVVDEDGAVQEGDCLPTRFTDDSAIGGGSIGGSTRSSVPASSGSSSSGGSSSGSSSGSGSWSGGSGSGSSGGSTGSGSGSGGSSGSDGSGTTDGSGGTEGSGGSDGTGGTDGTGGGSGGGTDGGTGGGTEGGSSGSGGSGGTGGSGSGGGTGGSGSSGGTGGSGSGGSTGSGGGSGGTDGGSGGEVPPPTGG